MSAEVVTYPYVCTLTPDLIEKAEKELNEKEQWRERDIQALRDMVVANKGLKCPLDSAFLLRFLRARKFDYGRAYELIIRYYTIRAENFDLLKDLLPSATGPVLDSYVSCLLPEKDKLGRRILYVRPGKWNPDLFPMLHLVKGTLLNLEYLIKEEDDQVNGIVVILNLADIGMNHVRNIDRSFFRINSSIIQDAFPIRLKSMHYINEPTVFGYLFSLIKPFLKEKMVQRLNFHGSSLESLQGVFNKSCLPKELGGDLPHGDELAELWNKNLRENEAMFHEMKSYRIELPKNIFGSKVTAESSTECLVGSYKKIIS